MNANWCAVATFCDDIRHERGNKHSLIGCYSGDTMIIDQVPAVLPRLCAEVKIVLPIAGQIDDIMVRATLNGEFLGELQIPAHDVNGLKDEVLQRGQEDGTDIQRITINAFMAFSPVVVQEASTLQLEATANGESYRISRLMIRQRTADDPPF